MEPEAGFSTADIDLGWIEGEHDLTALRRA